MAKLLGATPLRGAATSTTRAKDSDRQDACQILDHALNDGEISDQEHRERVSAATNAVTLGDLRALVEDLQADSAGLRSPARTWPTVAAMSNLERSTATGPSAAFLAELVGSPHPPR
ncbi:DUF1707 domain-containing protein [Mycobacterium sp. 1081908.1]|uniref:DUF1707 SHOCT-like domain-containing protein n=1 Tax=Mycobacterium sp. 1081908.1 TaxID=1834066 RepID=UPI0009EEAF07